MTKIKTMNDCIEPNPCNTLIKLLTKKGDNKINNMQICIHVRPTLTKESLMSMSVETEVFGH